MSNKDFSVLISRDELVVWVLGEGWKLAGRELFVAGKQPGGLEWVPFVRELGDDWFTIEDHVESAMIYCGQDVSTVVLHPNDFAKAILEGLFNPMNIRSEAGGVLNAGLVEIGQRQLQTVWVKTMPEAELQKLSPDGVGYTKLTALFAHGGERLRGGQGEW